MKEVVLTNGDVALVDDEDYEIVTSYTWRRWGRHNVWYAYTTSQPNILMHRLIMGLPDGIIDHKDKNGLNNQKANLRVCTNAENIRNSRKRKDNTSGYKGVIFKCAYHKGKKYPLKKPWQAYIHFNKKQIHIGYYHTSEEAARAYDKKAKKYFGEFACLNFPL
jgi:hypothetical protein